MEFNHVNLRPRMDWTDGKCSNEDKVANRPGMLTRQSGNLNRLKTRAEEQQSGNGCASTGINTPPDNLIVAIHNFHTTLNDDTEKKDNTGVLVEETVDKECLPEEAGLSVKEVKGARSAKNSEVRLKKDQKKQSRDQEIHAVDSIKGSTEGNNIAKRKRGRPKKLSQKQIGERSTGPNMKDSCVGDEARSIGQIACVVSTAVDEISNNGNFQPPSPSKEVIVYSRRRSGVCGLRKTATTPLHEDQTGETISSERINRTNNSVSDGHGESRKTVDSELRYQGDLPVENLNQCAASNDKGGGLEIAAIVSIDSMETEESLPFVKRRRRVWSCFDSDEIYKKMKPKLHFSPLYKYKEETREELAINQVQNFLKLVDDTSALQFSSDISVIESSLKCVAELESHGFDVEKVQASLTGLLLKKQRGGELQKEYEDIESKISNSSEDGELDEEISQLRQKLIEIGKKLDEAKSKKENREKGLSALQSNRESVAENVKSLQVEFESIVGSLW